MQKKLTFVKRNALKLTLMTLALLGTGYLKANASTDYITYPPTLPYTVDGVTYTDYVTYQTTSTARLLTLFESTNNYQSDYCNGGTGDEIGTANLFARDDGIFTDHPAVCFTASGSPNTNRTYTSTSSPDVLSSSGGSGGSYAMYYYSFDATRVVYGYPSNRLLYVPGLGYTFATTSTTTLPLSVNTTNFTSFLNVPYLLQTKVPFAYFFQAKDVITQVYSTSSTTTLPSGTFGVFIHGGTTTVDLFSTTTIGKYFTPTMVSLFRGLAEAVLYAGFIYTLYHLAKGQHLI